MNKPKIPWSLLGLFIVTVLVSTLLNILIVIPWVQYRDSHTNLGNIIRSCPYSPDEYQEGVFDCSNMAAMLDAWLEYHGHPSWILIFSRNVGAGHAIVLVDGVLVEPTTKTFRTMFGGEPVVIGNMEITPPNLADGTYSGLVRIVDNPSQLGSVSLGEWGYPERW